MHAPSSTILALLLTASAATAQTRTDPRRDIADQAAPPRMPATASAQATSALQKPALEVLGRGSEFGEQAILRRRAHVEPWSASLDALLAYTDNVALAPRGERSDWYLRTGLNVAYTNRVRGPWFIDLALQHYLFRYAEYGALDFDQTRIEAGVLYQAAWLDDTFLFARYSYQRLCEPWLGSELFTSHSAILGAQKVWKISRGQQVFAGLSGDLSLSADPASGARDEYSVVLGYSARLTQRLGAQLTYRLGLYDYREGGREDWNHIAALGLTYDVTDWLRLSATTSFSRNTSSASFAEYDNFVGGIGLSLRAAF